MKPTDFSVHLTNFLTHYLAAQRNLSPNTIKAYRDVFTLLLRFCRDVQGIVPERLCLEPIDVTRVETLLDYLEKERKILSSYTKSSARCLACFLQLHSGRRTGPCSANRKIYVESTDAHALRIASDGSRGAGHASRLAPASFASRARLLSFLGDN